MLDGIVSKQVNQSERAVLAGHWLDDRAKHIGQQWKSVTGSDQGGFELRAGDVIAISGSARAVSDLVQGFQVCTTRADSWGWRECSGMDNVCAEIHGLGCNRGCASSMRCSLGLGLPLKKLMMGEKRCDHVKPPILPTEQSEKKEVNNPERRCEK